MREEVKLERVPCIEDIKEKGQYALVRDNDGKNKVILGCPACTQIMVLPHSISLDHGTLTLQNPDNPNLNSVYCPADQSHHFKVFSGEIVWV